jgi:preprotein translocase subunit SecD
VKGFAFTLGLSTILDLVVVFLFTHPLVSMLSRLRSFGSRRFTGLDAIRGGPALPDEPPARSTRTRPQRASGRAAPSRRSSSVAVADPNQPDEAAPAREPAQTEPRRQADPAPGSAAERAAARRARLREQKGDQ